MMFMNICENAKLHWLVSWVKSNPFPVFMIHFKEILVTPSEETEKI